MVVTIAFSSTKPEKNLVNDISEKSTYYIIIILKPFIILDLNKNLISWISINV